jgi:hypothetical protein
MVMRMMVHAVVMRMMVHTVVIRMMVHTVVMRMITAPCPTDQVCEPPYKTWNFVIFPTDRMS